MFKLAYKNISSKPLRSIATILAVAVVVAMVFCMLSFKGAVYDFIFATETSAKGNSDITISTNSSSDRITKIADPLKDMDGVEDIVPSLKLYALFGDEYVQVRGFLAEQLDSLQEIDVVEGDISAMQGGKNSDNIIISQSASRHFALNVGDVMELVLGDKSITCIVGAISEQSGYFLNDSPYQVIGLTKQISKLITGSIDAKGLCNEIYITLKDGVDVNATIAKISSIDAYSQMLVSASQDESYIAEKTQSLTAPVVLAGGAVLLLGIAIIVLLFMMSESEKVAYISKLSVVGATKKQIFTIFLIESAILACVGTIIGSALAIGVFVGLLKLTLSKYVVFSISVGFLFGAGAIGLVTSMLSSLAPILRSFKGTIRENQLNSAKPSVLSRILPLLFAVLTVVSVAIEFCVSEATAVMAVFGMLFALATLVTACASIMRLGAKIMGKAKLPSVKLASLNLVRGKRFSRSVTMLTAGMTIAMMLFMAWSLTTTVFTSYVSEFTDMVFVTNIQASANAEDFKQVEGVADATKMVWKSGEILIDGDTKTMNILGSKDMLDIVDFEYITAKSVVNERISSDKPYVFVDIALQKLYGIQEGDRLEMTIEGQSHTVEVGGVLKHTLFSGNYIVASSEMLDAFFYQKADTILCVNDGDLDNTLGGLRARFAENNYYVISVLEAFRWDMDSMQSVFDLIGTLAVAVAIFIFAVTVASTLIGRGVAKRENVALLNAGMSKKDLLSAEFAEHSLIAFVAYVLSFATSVLLTSSLIHSLRLFGLYFEFMYEAWVVAVVGGVMSAGYALVPLAFNFKKGYTVKRI